MQPLDQFAVDALYLGSRRVAPNAEDFVIGPRFTHRARLRRSLRSFRTRESTASRPSLARRFEARPRRLDAGGRYGTFKVAKAPTALRTSTRALLPCAARYWPIVWPVIRLPFCTTLAPFFLMTAGPTNGIPSTNTCTALVKF